MRLPRPFRAGEPAVAPGQARGTLAVRRRGSGPAGELGARPRRRRWQPVEVDADQGRPALAIGALRPVERAQLEAHALELAEFGEFEGSAQKVERALARNEDRDRLGRMSVRDAAQAPILERTFAPLVRRCSEHARRLCRDMCSESRLAKPRPRAQAREQLDRVGRERQVVCADEPDASECVHDWALYASAIFLPCLRGLGERFCALPVERDSAVGYGPRPVGVGLQLVAAGRARPPTVWRPHGCSAASEPSCARRSARSR